MRADDWQMLYELLIRERDAANAQRPRDATRIDRIATDLMHLERSLPKCYRYAAPVIGSALDSRPLHSSVPM